MIFFAGLVRDLALEADRRLADATEAAAARVAAAQKFLEAMWRYYNLVDFAVGQNDPKAAVAVRLAFDEAEGDDQGPAGRGARQLSLRSRRGCRHARWRPPAPRRCASRCGESRSRCRG